MRDLLERICKEEMQNNALQMTDLAARINFLAAKFDLSISAQNRLHTFRLTSNAILNRQKEPTQEELLRDAKTLAFFIKRITGADIPDVLYRQLPRADATYIVAPPSKRYVQRMRVCFQYADETYLYVSPVDAISDDLLRVRYNIPQINEEFNTTVEQLWRFAQLNLLDVNEDENGILTPSFIILEPDYLIDISTLAECFKDYGHHPLNYQLLKLQRIANPRPLLLGNIANLFLDEWIHAEGEVDYLECMKKAFRMYPIELAACEDLQDKEKEKQFFADCRMHFDHIRDTVQQTFNLPGYKLNKKDAVLEPSYICEALGLQGRLDYMQRDVSSFIEMKSGKADEFGLRNRVQPKENNVVQMLLYQAVLQYAIGVDHHKVNAYLFYTRYPLLYPARSSWAMVRRVMDVRNRIVADEYSIQLRNSIEYTTLKLQSITSERLNERGMKNKFWTNYLRPSIDSFSEKLLLLNKVERAYFAALYNFTAKEQYVSKSGDVEYEGCTGASALWLATLAEKLEAGEILYNLRIVENHAADEHKAYVLLAKENVFSVVEEFPESLPNFRQGDAIVLYERNTDADNVTNRMIFKGNIEEITSETLKVRLRARQQNPHLLPAQSLYALEHDIMDTAFRGMFGGLATFLTANQRRKDLLLAARLPEVDATYLPAISSAATDLDRIVLKAQAAKDYFLLLGPPGTGKTSQALRRMVEVFYMNEEAQILLLAYTNRAVDEICKALLSIKPSVDFIRVGNELSCDPSYREYLIERVLQDCNRRSHVLERIMRCRIFVGTVATLSNKPELFSLKTFDVAIIDEASQILEPQLLGLLSAQAPEGHDAIGKFILIGDHKQLPAVVQQTEQQTEVYEDSLRNMGMHNLRNSLFERLFCSLKQIDPDGCTTELVSDLLSRQGRMHPDIAHFPNRYFYEGKLETLGLPHQLEEMAANLRIQFFPSVAEEYGKSPKVNTSEACIAARLAKQVYDTCAASFVPEETIGIIAPYRSQIAMIRKELALLGIEPLNRILVDTVERFQGSERDVVIYSCCANRAYQLKFLSNKKREENCVVDRKLNVVLTRARKQLFITGVSEILKQDEIYRNLLKLIN
ncbi:DNA helicase [Bacteroides sp. 214]|nr:DNA helicase [Bacteroides sp. 214]